MRVHFHDARPVAEVKADLAKMGLKLTKEQQDFLDQHDGHRGLTIDDNRVYCRTCNKRDGQ